MAASSFGGGWSVLGQGRSDSPAECQPQTSYSGTSDHDTQCVWPAHPYLQRLYGSRPAVDPSTGAIADVDILIIGAGVAGLSAAQAIRQENAKLAAQRKPPLRYLVVDARNRLGGRVDTRTLADGSPLDLGATFFHGNKNNAIYDLAASKHGVKTVECDWEDMIGLASTATTNVPKILEKAFADIESLLDEARKRWDATDPSADISVWQLFEEYLLPRHGRDPSSAAGLRYALAGDVECDYAADVRDMSAWYWDDDAEVKGGDFVLPQGMAQVIKILRQDVPVLLNAEVKRVAVDGANSCRAYTHDALIRAKKVLVTVPLGVLQRSPETIAFEPALPAHFVSAVNSLGMANLVWVHVVFEERWWPAATFKTSGFIANLSHDTFVNWPLLFDRATLFPLSPPIISFVAGGAAGHRIDRLTDAEVLSEVHGVLLALTGEQPPAAKSLVRSRWSHDPYALGTYSYKRVGYKKAAAQVLETPINNTLFFAGEHTHPTQPSTLQGAHLSGIRAARQMLSNQTRK